MQRLCFVSSFDLCYEKLSRFANEYVSLWPLRFEGQLKKGARGPGLRLLVFKWRRLHLQVMIATGTVTYLSTSVV